VRRLAITILSAAFAGAVGLGLAASSATATTPPTAPDTAPPASPDSDMAPVDVLTANGLFDPIVVESIHDAIERSEANGAQALIIKIDTRGTVVGRDDIQRLAEHVAEAEVPVGIWVGQARASRAYGPAAQLLAVADVTAMVGGSRIGYIGEPLVVNGEPLSFGPATAELVDGSMSFNQARAAGVLKIPTSDEGVPTLLSMVKLFDEQEIDGVRLNTVAEQLGDEPPLATTTVLSKLNLMDALMHTVASPSMAYLLFVIGLALLIFEFYTAGGGIAATVGVVCVLLGCYGLATLPTRPLGVTLLVLAMLAFAVDVQVGVPRLWTGVGTALFVAASLLLYRSLPSESMRLGWLTLLVGVGGVLLTFVVGMPSMVRTRFATPTIGREWMIGEMGSATTSISPEGVVLVGGGRWRARTNRATPIAAGQPVRVVAIDGITLDVEPEDGAAKDYRERRAKA
jgi:membrane-bound serine protease (ClpP class)